MLPKTIGGKIPPKEHKKLITEDTVSDVIDRALLAKRTSLKGVRKDCMFGVEKFGPMWVAPLLTGDSMFFHPDDVNDPSICWPMSVGFLGYNYEDGERLINFSYWRSVEPQQLRGQYKFVSRKNVGLYTGALSPDGSFIAAVDYGGWDGSRWRSCRRIYFDAAFLNNVPDAGTAPIKLWNDLGENDVGTRVALGQSIALTMRYEWGAQFSRPGSPKVIVPTTPRGVLELFNDREKPEDRDRRAALRHWVTQHIRRSDIEDFVPVREHLRGELSFSWRGFDVTIKPSSFDLERAEQRKKAVMRNA
jgi:hypothetical protein